MQFTSSGADSLEALIRTFVSNSPIPQLLHTSGGRTLALSRAFVESTGYTVEDIPRSVEWMMKGRRLDHESALVMLQHLERLCAAGPPHRLEEIEVFTKDGSPRCWLFQMVDLFQDASGQHYYLSSAVDITERQQLERELAVKAEFVDKIFRTHPTILYIFDLQLQQPIFQNRHIGETIGYSYEEIQQLGSELLQRLMHPEDFAQLPAHLARLSRAADHEIIAFEYRMRHRNGSWHWTISHDTVFTRDEAGKVLQILGTASDVTESKRLAQERLEMSVHVQELQKMESLAMLAGGIAHDFNNLLVGIMGSADLALMQVPPTSPATEDLQRIQETAIECAELCKQLLAYAGKGKFIVEPFYLSEVIEQIGHLLHISISKRVSLRYDFAKNVPPVEGDVRQIRQVIMNLIKNASEAIGDRSGVVTVAVGMLEANHAYLDGAILGEGLKEGYYVTLEVSDTGCGISQANLSRIFDPFYSSKREGRGLGLAAVRGIIKNHGGALRVYSEEGKGSSFKILLPASEAPIHQQEPAQHQTDTLLGGGTVLVVDDEETVRAVATRSLKMLGFSVLQATDGREAVAIYREYQSEIRVVLLDMMMPGMGGAATFQQLRQLTPNVNVVLMSGYNEQEATNAFAGKGLAGFIQKPFRHADLTRTLRAALER